MKRLAGRDFEDILQVGLTTILNTGPDLSTYTTSKVYYAHLQRAPSYRA